MESAIKNLRNLCLGYTEGNSESVAKSTPNPETGIILVGPKISLDEISTLKALYHSSVVINYFRYCEHY